MSENVIDPYELTKDLADRIGINHLYAIVREIRGEGCKTDSNGFCFMGEKDE